jgi:probable rRNA maturation factor
MPAGELSVVLLDAAAMGELHAQFLDDPAPTDVITFEGDPTLGFAGEVCVCTDVAHAYAQSHGENLAGELMLYIVHGYLHLAGFDDVDPTVRRRMRRAETRALTILRAANAVPSFILSGAGVGNDPRGRRL